MGPRLVFMLSFSAVAVSALVAVAVGTWLIESNLADDPKSIAGLVIVYGGGIAFLLVAMIALAWAYVDNVVARPLAALVRGIQTVIYADPECRIEIDDSHQLDGLPDAVKQLVDQMAAARSRVNEAIAEATSRVEQQKHQLEIILQDLHEGVIVCDLNHHILLYNKRAAELLHVSD